MGMRFKHLSTTILLFGIIMGFWARPAVAAAAGPNDTQSGNGVIAITVRNVEDTEPSDDMSLGCWWLFGKRQTYEVQLGYDVTRWTNTQDVQIRLTLYEKLNIGGRKLITAEIFDMDGNLLTSAGWTSSMWAWHSTLIRYNQDAMLYLADESGGSAATAAWFSNGYMIKQSSSQSVGMVTWTFTEGGYMSIWQIIVEVAALVASWFIAIFLEGYYVLKEF